MGAGEQEAVAIRFHVRMAGTSLTPVAAVPQGDVPEWVRGAMEVAEISLDGVAR